MKSRFFTIINCVLMLLIVLLLVHRYSKKQIVLEVVPGSEPRSLIDIVGEYNIHFKKRSVMIIATGQHPSPALMENIDKLSCIFKNDMDTCAVFPDYVRVNKSFQFANVLLPRYKLSFRSSTRILSSPTFVLIRENKVVLAEDRDDFYFLATKLPKLLNPGPPPSGAQRSYSDRRSSLLGIIRSKRIRLLDIFSGKAELLALSGYPELDELRIITATCSSCALSKIATEISRTQQSGRKTMVIFPVYANSYEIRTLLREKPATCNLFLDYDDGLGLLHDRTRDDEVSVIFQHWELYE